jgi:hypothetical protein
VDGWDLVGGSEGIECVGAQKPSLDKIKKKVKKYMNYKIFVVVG